MTNRDIREQMERWARWRHDPNRHGYGRTVLQRMLEGMPGTNCPTCSGRGYTRRYPVCPGCSGAGRVRLDQKADRAVTRQCPECMRDGFSRGEIDGRTCHKCRGSGVAVYHAHKVNPAFISSTRVAVSDVICERIDRLVCELSRRGQTIIYWYVIGAEYMDSRGGTQEMKAQRCLLTVECYKKRLQRALEWIAEALPDERSCQVIPFPYKALDLPCHETVYSSPH